MSLNHITNAKYLYKYCFQQSDKVMPVIIGIHTYLPTSKRSRTSFIRINFCHCPYCETLKKEFCDNLETEWMKTVPDLERVSWAEEMSKKIYKKRREHCKEFSDFENNDFLKSLTNFYSSKNFLVLLMTAGLVSGILFASLYH